MRRRLKPRTDDITRREAAPRSGEEILAERRISVSGRVDRGGHLRTARGVGELPARSDTLALEYGRPLERWTTSEARAMILRARPVHEARDRPNLISRRRRCVIRRTTGTRGSKVGAPRTLRAVRATDDEQREDRRRRKRGHDETGRYCRRRKRHGSYRAPTSTGILPLIEGATVPRVSDPAPRQGSLEEPIDSPGWCVRQVAAASRPSASVGKTVSAR